MQKLFSSLLGSARIPSLPRVVFESLR